LKRKEKEFFQSPNPLFPLPFPVPAQPAHPLFSSARKRACSPASAARPTERPAAQLFPPPLFHSLTSGALLSAPSPTSSSPPLLRSTASSAVAPASPAPSRHQAGHQGAVKPSLHSPAFNSARYLNQAPPLLKAVKSTPPWPLMAIAARQWLSSPPRSIKTNPDPLQLSPSHSPASPAPSPHLHMRRRLELLCRRAIGGRPSSPSPVSISSASSRPPSPPALPAQGSRARGPSFPAGPSHPKLTAARAPPASIYVGASSPSPCSTPKIHVRVSNSTIPLFSALDLPSP
jgi:hypothetical protein